MSFGEDTKSSHPLRLSVRPSADRLIYYPPASEMVFGRSTDADFKSYWKTSMHFIDRSGTRNGAASNHWTILMSAEPRM